MKNGNPELALFLDPISAIGVGLLCIGIPVGALFLGFPWWFIWIILFPAWGYGTFSLLVGIASVVERIIALSTGTVQRAGTVTKKEVVAEHDSEFRTVWVQDRAFRVSKNIYDWVHQDQEVVVSYWPESSLTNLPEIVGRLDKV